MQTNYLKDKEIQFEGGRASHFFVSCLGAETNNEEYWKYGKTIPFRLITTGKADYVKWWALYSNDFDRVNYIKTFDVSVLDEIENNYQKKTEQIEEKILDLNLELLTNTQLYELLVSVIDVGISHWYDATILRALDRSFLEYVEQLNLNQKDKSEYIRMATTPDEMTITLQEKEAFLISDAAHLSHTYGAMFRGYFNEPMKSVEDYEKSTKEIQSNTDLRLELEKMIYEYNQERAQLDKYLDTLDKEMKNMATISSRIVYLKDYYKYSINKVLFSLEPIFDEISSRSNTPKDTLKRVYKKDWQDLLLNNIDISPQGKKHGEDYAILYNEQLHVLQGDEYIQIRDSYLREDTEEKFTTLTGRTAQNGLVKGKVSVVRGSNEFSKITEGDILVVLNTSPDYVPILKKVAGVVAEEGGITAHVSVISREFGIPAVVGVKNVTEILQDGDMVELDANKGTVKILEK